MRAPGGARRPAESRVRRWTGARGGSSGRRCFRTSSPAALLALALGARAAAGQASCPAERDVSWHPERPRAGTLFTVRVAATSGGVPGRVGATVAGEPLHLRPEGGAQRGLVAFAAVPVDSVDGVWFVAPCASGPDVAVRIPTRAGDYPVERLRVAPRYTAPPDSTLAARMRREAEAAATVSRAAHDTPRLWSAPFTAPRDARVTSPFGSARAFNGTVTSRHMGTDYAGAVGAPVRAANRGVVRLVEAFHLGGNVVYLDHGEGLVTAYLHLSRHLVAVGDTVARGAVIGRVGATGRVTGPHLHFIARYGGITVDPASLPGLRAR